MHEKNKKKETKTSRVVYSLLQEKQLWEETAWWEEDSWAVQK